MGVPFQRGDQLALISYSSLASPFSLFANIRRDSGVVDSYRMPALTPASDRSIATLIGGPLGAPGTIEGFVINRRDSEVTLPKRGQTWVIVNLLRSKVGVMNLSTAYWSDAEGPALGVYRTPGPGGGHGFETRLVLAQDIAGNVATNAALAATNALRLVRGFIILYNSSSDIADRTVQMVLRRPLGDLPTGFINVAAQVIWQSPIVTLSADQEGLVYAGEGFATVVTNDNGTLAVADNTTAPSPFPFWLEEGETAAQLRTNIGAGEAADRYSMYAIVEEWIWV